jgi:glycosyltransferase involved in cell wall biosynthesis
VGRVGPLVQMTISTTDIHSKQETPAVSVVIPVYNAALYIRDALDSVLAQTFTHYEVIVVNDGSTDREELERVLDSHPLQIVYLSQENRGVSAARNAAIHAARGTFYAQLDADDQWEPEYLAAQLGILRGDEDVALVYPNAVIFGDSSDASVEFMKICPSEGEVTFESLIRQDCTVMTCVLARMNAVKGAGMFDEAIPSCEDFDLWLRIIKNGGRIIYHRQVLARYRRREGSLSSDRVWMTRNLLAVLEKAANTFDLTTAERETLNEQLTCQRALLRLFEGKHALARGETGAAFNRFREANRYLRSPKLALVIWLLQHTPRLFIWAFAVRERFLAKRHARLLTGIDIPSRIVSSDEIEGHRSE